MNMIYITKPGNTLQVREGKSNMQLYELHVIESICNEHGLQSELRTTNELLETDLTNSKIVIFVSIEDYNYEFENLVSHASNFENVHFFLVSNDPRLKFRYRNDNRKVDKIKFTMLTNATRNLEQYLELSFDSHLADNADVIGLPFWTQPAFYIEHPISSDNKEYKSVFYCLHFNEMSKYRQETVIKLNEQLGDDLLLFGDSYPEHIEHEPTIDAMQIPNVLSNVHTLPVLLEERHQYYGALTSRISEAIMAGAWPFIIYEIGYTAPPAFVDFPNGTTESYVSFINYIDGLKAPEYFMNLLKNAMNEFETGIIELLK